jgi:ribose/xylose/arabinose/galactoside ABC-type transport system permease subunit
MLRFMVEVLAEVFGVLIKFLIAFGIGTGSAALVCWLNDIPMVVSLMGGFVVLGLTLAFSSDNPFFS